MRACGVCRVFRASKFAFVDTLVVVLKDVKWFLLFLLFTMWVRWSCQPPCHPARHACHAHTASCWEQTRVQKCS